MHFEGTWFSRNMAVAYFKTTQCCVHLEMTRKMWKSQGNQQKQIFPPWVLWPLLWGWQTSLSVRMDLVEGVFSSVLLHTGSWQLQKLRPFLQHVRKKVSAGNVLCSVDLLSGSRFSPKGIQEQTWHAEADFAKAPLFPEVLVGESRLLTVTWEEQQIPAGPEVHTVTLFLLWH